MGGLLGGISNALFGDGGAGAAQSAAEAQQRMARQQYAQVKGITDRATTASLASYDRDLQNQEKNLARQEQLISQIDPTILEASQQALRLLRGEQSSTLGPAQQQRAQQRQKLLNQLREQLGPGAETSTAGIQALTRFDSETNNLLASQQQSALQGLGNVANQFNAVRPDMFREIMGRSQLGQGGANTLLNQASILQKSGQPLIDTAGSQFLGEQIRGQQDRAFGERLVGAAVGAGTGYFLGGKKGALQMLGGGGNQG